MWQDTVIAICQVAFLPAMWPTVSGKDKPALSTSALNALIVFIIAFSLATLRLWLSFGTSILIGLTWTILAVQKFKLEQANRAAETVESEPEDILQGSD